MGISVLNLSKFLDGPCMSQKKKKKSRTKVELSTLGNRQDLAQQWENFTPSIWVQETSPGYDDQGSEGCFASAGMRNQFSVYQTHLP